MRKTYPASPRGRVHERNAPGYSITLRVELRSPGDPGLPASNRRGQPVRVPWSPALLRFRQADRSGDRDLGINAGTLGDLVNADRAAGAMGPGVLDEDERRS
jgi:hypothetical protein